MKRQRKRSPRRWPTLTDSDMENLLAEVNGRPALFRGDPNAPIGANEEILCITVPERDLLVKLAGLAGRLLEYADHKPKCPANTAPMECTCNVEHVLCDYREATRGDE